MFANVSKQYQGLIALGLILITVAFSALALSYFASAEYDSRANYLQKEVSSLLSQARVTKENASANQLSGFGSGVTKFTQLLRNGGKIRGIEIKATEDKASLQSISEINRLIADGNFTNIARSLQDLSDAISTASQASKTRLRNFQLTALALSAVGALLLFTLLYRRMSAISAKLSSRNYQQRALLGGLKEGFFTLSNTLEFGELQSSATKSIFVKRLPLKGNFIELITPMIGSEKAKVVREYLLKLINQIDSKKLRAIPNPLSNIEFVMPSGISLVVSKHLNFEFSRTRHGREVELLVSVRDVSREIGLSKQLAETTAAQQRSLGRMGVAVKVPNNNKAVSSFYEAASETLRDVNSILEHDLDTPDQHDERLKRMHSKIAKVERSASKIGLEIIERSANQLDKQIAQLQAVENLDNKQLLSLLGPLKQMIADVEFTHQLSLKRGDARLSGAPQRTADIQLIKPLASRISESATPKARNHQIDKNRKLKLVTAELANRLGKSANLEVRGLYDFDLSRPTVSRLEAISIQLLHNALDNSIEVSDKRVRLNKPRKGQLTINLKPHDDRHVALVVRDDGAGLSMRKIKKQAVELGLFSEREINSIDQSKLVACLFKPAFAEAGKSSNHKQRIYGLDIVRKMVEDMHGKITVKSSSGLYRQFSIVFPKEALEQVAA